MKRVILIVAAGLLVLTALLGLLAITRPSPAAQELSEAQFVGMIHSNLLGKVEIRYATRAAPPSEVRGTFYQTDAVGQILMEQGRPKELPFRARFDVTSELERKLLESGKLTVVAPNLLVEKVSHWFRRSK